MLITTGIPCSAARRARSAGSPPERISLACACRLASAGGEPARRSRICASVSLDGSVAGVELLSCASPTISSTSTAAAARPIDRLLGVIAVRVPDRVHFTRASACYILGVRQSRVARASGEGRRGAPRLSRVEASLDGGSVSKSTASMAESTSVALAAATIPSSADIARAEKFVRERFLHEGEDPAEALAPGTPRRRALDRALAELEEDPKAKNPSTAWRREFSLLLGLERLLSEEEPKLADGTVLSAHQVDALSGTLTALLAEAQRSAPTATAGAASASPELLASADILGPDGVSGNGGQAALGRRRRRTPTRSMRTRTTRTRTRRTSEEDDEELGPVQRAAPDEDEEERGGRGGGRGGRGRGGAEEELEQEAESDEEPRDWVDEEDEEESLAEQPEDPNAAKRFWFEHATGAGKTVAALGFVEASHTGGVLILTHRRNLVDQFLGELRDRGYSKRISRPLLKGEDSVKGPVTVETYQWFVRNAGKISSAYTIVICDEAHTALGEKTSGAIREWTGPIFIGMTATGALIARHVTDLFPTQTSRFDLAQAARRGVIAPLRCVRISPGVGVRTIAKVPLRRGEVDTEFDQDELAKLLDQQPFNVAVANLYKTRFNGVPGVVYAAGVRHAYNLAEAFRAEGIKAQAVSGETPKRELVEILARYERGDIDVLINAQLLAEGWNSPRATVCVHLAPTASKRIYQQRVGRVTRRHPGKEAGLVVDFVHPRPSTTTPS